MISDKCDNDNHLNVKDKCSDKSKCCEANNKTTTTITCSSSSINFDNLQLQCMCSSDNNSLNEYQIENCDKDPDATSNLHKCDTQQTASFRERLLNFTSSNARNDEPRCSNLRKRNSELVLGTNFESTPLSGDVYKGTQSYRISCDNIFSKKSATASSSRAAAGEGNNKESNHSLFVESDHTTQIPYSFLERPTMKLSQSEDRNLRELKIALSSTLPSANNSNNSNGNKNQIIGNLKNSQIVTHQSNSYTSSSSTSSKMDKISFSLSTSSTSEAILGAVKKSQPQHAIGTDADSAMMTDNSNKLREAEIINKPNDDKSEDNEAITAPPIPPSDDINSAPVSNANNININNGSNGNGKKRKTPEGKLAIDLNDRSKYTEEVSV